MELVALQVALQGIDIVVHSPARAIGEPRDGHHRLSACQKMGERSQLTWQHAHSFRQVNAAIDRGTLGTVFIPKPTAGVGGRQVLVGWTLPVGDRFERNRRPSTATFPRAPFAEQHRHRCLDQHGDVRLGRAPSPVIVGEVLDDVQQ